MSSAAAVLLRLSGRAGWKAVLQAADRSALKIEPLVRSAFVVSQRSVDFVGLEAALLQRSDRQAEALLISATAEGLRLLDIRLPALIRDALTSGGEAEAGTARRTGSLRSAARPRNPVSDLHFDLVNPEAERWARERSSTLIRQITTETRLAIRRALGRSFSEGIPTAQVAKLLQGVVGLTEDHAQAVLNLRSRIAASPGKLVHAGKTVFRVPLEGASRAFFEAKIAAYSQRLLVFRTNNIARTEALAASNEGQRQLWTQAAGKGLLYGDELRVWIITGDKRICPRCEGSKGDLAPIDKPFPNGVMNPPLHGMCRCAVGLSRKRGKASVKVGKPPLLRSLPSKGLDKLLKPGKNDAFFPGDVGNIASDPAAAERVWRGFEARAEKLWADNRIKVELPEYVQPWLSVQGRAVINAANTALEQIQVAVARVRAAGAMESGDTVRLAFEASRGTEYARVIPGPTPTVNVNVNNPAWQGRNNLTKVCQRDFDIGFHPTPEPDSILVHEIGHVLHGNAGYKGKWSDAVGGFEAPQAESIASRVSRYAKNNADEFVGETFSGLVSGKKYDDEVMALYRRLGGPEINKKAVVALPKPLPIPRPLAPAPAPASVASPPLRPIPDGPAGDDIRRVLALRAEGKSYQEIARDIGWDPTPNPHGYGKDTQRVYNIIKRFGDPLKRVAPGRP